jgi:uncharacterized membrane protein
MFGGRSIEALRGALWLGLLVLAVLVGGVALRYADGDPAALPHELRDNLLANPIAFPLHTTFGGLAMLLGPWQLVAGLRRRWPAAHRWAGRAYVVCCLVSGVTAYPVAFSSFAGPIAAAGFSVMATAWLAATLVAVLAIRRGQVAAHRRWMIRSFALTLSALTLRVVLALPQIWPWLDQIDYLLLYRSSTWFSWSCNLALAELWLRVAGAARRPQETGALPSQA